MNTKKIGSFGAVACAVTVGLWVTQAVAVSTKDVNAYQAGEWSVDVNLGTSIMVFDDTKSCFEISQDNIVCYYDIPDGKLLIVEAVNGNTERGPLERLYFQGRIDGRFTAAHIIPDNQFTKQGGTIYSGHVTLYLSSSQAFTDPNGVKHDFTATSIVETTNVSGRILGPNIIGRIVPMSN